MKTEDGFEKVNKCPKCNGYFKESCPTSFWWSQLFLIPMFWLTVVPDEFEILKYSIFAILITGLPILLFMRERKRKRIIQKKGEWVVVKTINI